MITDSQTNLVYFADTIIKNHPDFFITLNTILQQNAIPVKIIKNTVDIWARDYMPIQVKENEFIQFDYHPDYLENMPELRTDPAQVTIHDNLSICPSDLVIDGGNVIKGNDWAILTSKVMDGNPQYSQKQITQKLEELFDVDKIIWIPWQKKYDEFGHADGMVQYYDKQTVLVNDYSQEKTFQKTFLNSLDEKGLKWIEIPYNPYKNEESLDASGIYVNFLQVNNLILLPVFNQPEDDGVIDRVVQLFPDSEIKTVYSQEIAKGGGVLNCISWNFKKSDH